MHSSAAFPIRFQALKIQYCRYHVSANTFGFSMNVFHLSSRRLAVSQLKPDTQRSFFWQQPVANVTCNIHPWNEHSSRN